MSTTEQVQAGQLAVEVAPKKPAFAPRKRLLSRITVQSRFYPVRLLLENSGAVFGLCFLFLVLLMTLIYPSISSYDAFRVNPVDRYLEPSRAHWIGTDQMGRDIFLRAVYGARTSLLVGVSVMLISTFAGSVIGLIAGYYQRLDTALMRVMDGLMAFPGILLAIALMASLGPNTENVVVALGIVYMPSIARVVRGQTLSVKNQLYVEAARAIGVRDFQILRRHIFMNALSPLIVQASFVVAFAIIAEASLSFLGVGVDPEIPTWGNMLRDGQQVIHTAWWAAVYPGSLIFMTVLALNFIGDGLRDALDPRSRQR